MTEPPKLSGVWCATLTPLDIDGRADHDRLVAHVRRLFANGVDGIALFGTTGEGQSFSVAERLAGLEALLDADIDPMRIVVGTGCAALPETVELTRHAVACGCAGARDALDSIGIGCAESRFHFPQRNAAVCTGASHKPMSSSSSFATVTEHPAISSDVT